MSLWQWWQEQNCVCFSISGTSLNYLPVLPFTFVSLSLTDDSIIHGGRQHKGERRCQPRDSDAFRRHCCSSSRRPEINGACSQSPLHVYQLYSRKNSVIIRHDVAFTQQYFKVLLCLCGVCLGKPSIRFQSSCSHHRLLLLVSPPPRQASSLSDLKSLWL